MKITFKDEALSELYETGKTKDRKYKQLCKSKKLVDGYIQEVPLELSMAWLNACCLQKRKTELK